MSGGRLTRDERLGIGRGLADGLDYAEIARGLGRPTSTVTREVQRNGGPHAYHAERAHETAADRARRGRLVRGKQAATPGDEPTVLRDYEDGLVAMAIATGFPRMMARVLFALLVTDSGELSASALARRLAVSPASVSRAVRDLEQLGFLRRERTARPRSERYAVEDDAWQRVWVSQVEGIGRWAAEFRRGPEMFGPGHPSGARLGELGRFLDLVQEHMAEVADRVRRP
jgi:DNA-binding transcriptional ArsR family regulator